MGTRKALSQEDRRGVSSIKAKILADLAVGQDCSIHRDLLPSKMTESEVFRMLEDARDDGDISIAGTELELAGQLGNGVTSNINVDVVDSLVNLISG